MLYTSTPPYPISPFVCYTKAARVRHNLYGNLHVFSVVTVGCKATTAFWLCTSAAAPHLADDFAVP